jgi:Rps23 Pro-64 3,4-dihydroxylase Tpa1-like proline 4-hydroxylase
VTVPLTPLQRVPRHVVRENVLPAEECAALLQWVLANEEVLVPSRIGTGLTAPNVRRSFSVPKTFERPWLKPMVARMRALGPELMAELGLPPTPIDKMEADMVSYRDGGFVRPHIDTAAGYGREASDRMLTMVYYFHREPKGFGGGALRLFPLSRPPEGAPEFDEIVPAQNSLIAFASWAPHEVRPVSIPSGEFSDSRFAINFWARRAPHQG